MAEPLEVADARARDRVEDAPPQRFAPRVGGTLEPELDVRPQVARELLPGHQPLAIRGAAEVDRARPLDEGLVEVEERTRGHDISRTAAAARSGRESGPSSTSMTRASGNNSRTRGIEPACQESSSCHTTAMRSPRARRSSSGLARVSQDSIRSSVVAGLV